MPDFHVTFRDLLHAVNLRHGTNGFTSLPKEGVLRIFFALKNPTASTGFESANLGTKGQHATFGSSKPLRDKIRKIRKWGKCDGRDEMKTKEGTGDEEKYNNEKKEIEEDSVDEDQSMK